MSDIQYWADIFDIQQKNNPHDPVKALNFSNIRLMNQVHEQILSCIDFSRIQPPGRILDTGCGTGALLGKLIVNSQFTAHGGYATDISHRMLEKARETAAHAEKQRNRACHWQFCRMSVDQMGFKPGSFDLVLASESLQYTDPCRAIVDLIRMTKKGGQIVISIPNASSPFIRNAVEKHQGRFSGLEFNIAFAQIAPRVAAFRVKPLIFAENQAQKPYLETDLKQRLTRDEIHQANRFVISLTV